MDDIVILAGGECKPDLAAISGVPNRADIPFDGKTFLQIAYDAVKPLGEPLIVGGTGSTYKRQIPGGNSFVESIGIAANEISSDRFLLVFADLPFLTTEAVAEFLKNCNQSAEVNYPIIPIEDCQRDFPNLKRTTVKIAEGEFTGGNIGFFDRKAILNSLPLLEKLYSVRKSPFKLAKLLGLKTFSLLAQASLNPTKVPKSRFEAAISELLQLKVEGVIVHQSGIGTDIDNAEQYQQIFQFQKS